MYVCMYVGNIEFNKLVRENAIVTDAESADNLFRILSQNRASESHDHISEHKSHMITSREHTVQSHMITVRSHDHISEHKSHMITPREHTVQSHMITSVNIRVT